MGIYFQRKTLARLLYKRNKNEFGFNNILAKREKLLILLALKAFILQLKKCRNSCKNLSFII